MGGVRRQKWQEAFPASQDRIDEKLPHESDAEATPPPDDRAQTPRADA